MRYRAVVRRPALGVHDVGAQHERSGAVDDVIHLAYQIVLGHRRFGGDLAAVDHADIDVGLPDAYGANLLVGDAGVARDPLQIVLHFLVADVGAWTAVATGLPILRPKR